MLWTWVRFPPPPPKNMRQLLIILFFLFLLIPIPVNGSDVLVHNLETVKLMKNKPIRLGSWKYTPTIVICDTTPVEYSNVKDAVNWWKKRGHRFYHTIYKNDHLNICRRTEPEGYIVIKFGSNEIFKDDSNAEAITHFFVENNTNQVLWAKIYLRSLPFERILEHELGHALGYLHVDRSGHLMNQKWVNGGWNDEGLKSR